MKEDASFEVLSGVMKVIHSGFQTEVRMVLICQERYSVLTVPAKPQLLGCGLTTKVNLEIYLLRNFRDSSTHLDMQK